jgi:hypothetical protein
MSWREQVTLYVMARTSYIVCHGENKLHIVCHGENKLHCMSWREQVTLYVMARTSYIVCHGENKLHCMSWREQVTLYVMARTSYTLYVMARTSYISLKGWSTICSRPTRLLGFLQSYLSESNVFGPLHTLSRFLGNQSLLSLVNAAYIAEKQHIPTW